MNSSFLNLLILCVPPLYAVETTTVPKPNFILFLIDDQNAESIGAVGGKTFTPNLGHMAAD